MQITIKMADQGGGKKRKEKEFTAKMICRILKKKEKAGTKFGYMESGDKIVKDFGYMNLEGVL
jgi:hypothetical protein